MKIMNKIRRKEKNIMKISMKERKKRIQNFFHC